LHTLKAAFIKNTSGRGVYKDRQKKHKTYDEQLLNWGKQQKLVKISKKLVFIKFLTKTAKKT